MKRYACKYILSFETDYDKGFTKEEIEQNPECGGADAFLLFSIIHQENGGTSICILPRDDENKKQELSNTDLFNCWVALANKILESNICTDFQKGLAQEVITYLRHQIGIKP